MGSFNRFFGVGVEVPIDTDGVLGSLAMLAGSAAIAKWTFGGGPEQIQDQVDQALDTHAEAFGYQPVSRTGRAKVGLAPLTKEQHKLAWKTVTDELERRKAEAKVRAKEAEKECRPQVREQKLDQWGRR